MDHDERLLTMDELRIALAEKMPRRKGEAVPPCRRTIYLWLAAKPYPMPSVPRPTSGRGTGRKTVHMFLRSQVFAWLDDPAAYWTRRQQEGGTVPFPLGGRRTKAASRNDG
jgi:hypothetical protein